MEYEAKAIAMHKYMAHSVPGLLQTAAYARELLRLGQPWCRVCTVSGVTPELEATVDD
jgi:hypothetical protein